MWISFPHPPCDIMAARYQLMQPGTIMYFSTLYVENLSTFSTFSGVYLSLRYIMSYPANIYPHKMWISFPHLPHRQTVRERKELGFPQPCGWIFHNLFLVYQHDVSMGLFLPHVGIFPRSNALLLLHIHPHYFPVLSQSTSFYFLGG